MEAGGRARSARAVFRAFWPYTRGDRARLLAARLLSLVLLGCELGSVIIFESIISKVLETHDLGNFRILAGLWLAVAAAGAVAMAGSGWLTGLAAERIQLQPRDAVFAHLQRLPADYFDERQPGDLMASLTRRTPSRCWR
jgi:ATP-binding cassette subfamily B protein